MLLSYQGQEKSGSICVGRRRDPCESHEKVFVVVVLDRSS